MPGHKVKELAMHERLAPGEEDHRAAVLGEGIDEGLPLLMGQFILGRGTGIGTRIAVLTEEIASGKSMLGVMEESVFH